MRSSNIYKYRVEGKSRREQGQIDGRTRARTSIASKHRSSYLVVVAALPYLVVVVMIIARAGQT